MTDTMTSGQAAPIPNGQMPATAGPGSTGPGAQMSMTSAVLLTIGVAAGGLVGLGLIFRKGQKVLPPLRIDAANAINIYFSWLLIDGTLKLVAYRYHGHKLSQAYLLIA
jgi:hypothetical protein